MYLEKIPPAEIESMEIPSGVPLVYRFNKVLEVVGKAWME
jgi:bisphosphoglycerate-dependent phosphoglycerate mutase